MNLDGLTSALPVSWCVFYFLTDSRGDHAVVRHAHSAWPHPEGAISFRGDVRRWCSRLGGLETPRPRHQRQNAGKESEFPSVRNHRDSSLWIAPWWLDLYVPGLVLIAYFLLYKQASWLTAVTDSWLAEWADLRSKVWLQIISSPQDGSVLIQDILVSFLDPTKLVKSATTQTVEGKVSWCFVWMEPPGGCGALIRGFIYASGQIHDMDAVWISLISSLQVQQCRYNPSYRAANCSRYSCLPEGDEGALKQAAATIGPISVNIDAQRPKFALYKSGRLHIVRLSGADCPNWIGLLTSRSRHLFFV